MNINKKTTIREFLQVLGTSVLRESLHEDIHLMSLFADYKESKEGVLHKTYSNEPFVPKLPNWFISDCRFPNEAKAIKNRGGLIIRINRSYDWAQFCKLYGVVGLDNPVNNPETKFPALTWGNFLKMAEPTENIKGAINKVFHSSETSLDDYSGFDYVINNDGTLEDFNNEIEKCLRSLQVTEEHEHTV